MPDGTSRFSIGGKKIHHYMGCSTFANHTVMPEIALAKVREDAPFDKICYIGCGVTTGIGAVIYTAKVEPGANVVVFGLGGIGLNVVQGARIAGADMIVGVDINPAREALGRKFGMTHFVNPEGDRGDLVAHLVELTGGGADYSFECVGNVKLMRQALECCHRGWGESVIIGVAGAGQEISTRPFQLVTGRVWKGTAFGGARGRTDVPKIVDWYMDGKIDIDASSRTSSRSSASTRPSTSCTRAVDPHGRGVLSVRRPSRPSASTAASAACRASTSTRARVRGPDALRVYLPPAALEARAGARALLPRGPHLHRGDLRRSRPARSGGRRARPRCSSPATRARARALPGRRREHWDFGLGAGFYLDATRPVVGRVPDVPTSRASCRRWVEAHFPVAPATRAASSGTRWAATARSRLALRNPGRSSRAVSAFAPIVRAAARCPWGQKALRRATSGAVHQRGVGRWARGRARPDFDSKTPFPPGYSTCRSLRQ
jgi:NADPH:quinone reductase-like Zn-dependent oxidoreductase